MMKSKPKVLVLGSGGREHALVWHLQKYGCDVECSPGSDAIAQIAEVWKFENSDELIERILHSSFDEVIIGPEKYLADAYADKMRAKGISVFGPSKAAAQLETSKAFAKAFCQKYSIPSSRYFECRTGKGVEDAVSEMKPPYVVKASGLAAGKGVWIGESKTEAIEAGRNFLKDHDSIVIEDFIKGTEVSCFYLIDHKKFSFLGAACDHKRLNDNDKGPNTGGMGAYSPPRFWSEDLRKKIEKEILHPTIQGLEAESLSYRGFLFLGVILDDKLQPHLLEYNCRMGDPETQALLPRIKTSLYDLVKSLDEPEFDSRTCVSVVLASKDYPSANKQPVALPELVSLPEDLICFHAGTIKDSQDWLAVGGRILSLSCLASDAAFAREKIYQFLDESRLSSKLHFRRDIAREK